MQNILIAEDAQIMINLISKMIHMSCQNKYNILQAKTGVQALKILQEEAIDILITDLRMPEMDGNELIQTLKKDIQLSHIKIIAMSGDIKIKTRNQLIKLGVDYFIKKPFSLSQISKIMNDLIKQ